MSNVDVNRHTHVFTVKPLPLHARSPCLIANIAKLRLNTVTSR